MVHDRKNTIHRDILNIFELNDFTRVTTHSEVISNVFLPDMDIKLYTGLTRLCVGYAASIFLLVGLSVLIPRFPLSGGEP